MGILKKYITINRSRRRFLGLSALALGTIAIVGKLWPFRQTKEKRTTKLLTHDGKLVEVDLDNLPTARKVVKKEELARWVWKDQSL
jgi:hypothetical protein